MASTWRCGFDAAGNAEDFPTHIAALADAGVATGDTIIIDYYDVNKSRSWPQTSSCIVTKGVWITGGLPNRQISLVFASSSNLHAFYVNAAITAQVSNLTIVAGNGLADAFSSASTNNYNIQAWDCTVIGANTAVYLTSHTSAGSWFKNLLIMGGYIGVQIINSDVEILNCTAFRLGLDGFYSSVNNAKIKNCAAIDCKIGFTANWNAASDYNRSTDATAPGAHSAQVSVADCKTVYDNSNGNFVWDGRVIPGSVLTSGGTDVGLTADIDGQAYTGGVFPIGCSKGIYLMDPDYVLTTAVPPGNYVCPAGGGAQLGAFENGVWR